MSLAWFTLPMMRESALGLCEIWLLCLCGCGGGAGEMAAAQCVELVSPAIYLIGSEFGSRSNRLAPF